VALDLNKILPFTNLQEAVNGADYVMVVVPAAFVSDALSRLQKTDLEGKKIISSIKGMIPESNILVTDYIHQQFGVPHRNMAVIGGPCHAEEVAMERQSYLTVASEDDDLSLNIKQLLAGRYINATTVRDLMGVEYAAVMKNIFAIACGIAHGQYFGDNFQAVLVSNCLQEMRRFLDAITPMERDLTASAYLGDLLVTAYSQFSRNRTFGNMIGRGYSVKSAQMEMEMVAEGCYAVKCIYEINKNLGVNMPVTSAVYHMLYEKISPFVEMSILKDRLK
jgi:glycerol-3-phosphate dehydrogenase (NAD(P)+)